MAKKSRPQSADKPKAGRAPASPPRDRIIDALITLLATRAYAEIGLANIAEEAEVSLGVLREEFTGKPAILSAFSRRIDQVVLDGGVGEGETPRDRVFDVLMRRFDALASYKEAIAGLMLAARRDLCLTSLLHCNAKRSMKWMLVAAGADRPGLLGAVAVRGLVVINAEAVRAWLDDDDPGLAMTMAALDRGLERGSRTMNIAGRVCERMGSFVARDRASRPGPANA